MAQMVHNKTTQALYAWGSNASGLLGLGDYEDRKQPEHNEKINFGIQFIEYLLTQITADLWKESRFSTKYNKTLQ